MFVPRNENGGLTDRNLVEKLRERCGSCHGALDEDPVLAQQVPQKTLAGTVYFRPTRRRPERDDGPGFNLDARPSRSPGLRRRGPSTRPGGRTRADADHAHRRRQRRRPHRGWL
jgi:hypothetical protein